MLVELHDDLRGEMKVRYYGSDGCVLIVRKQPGGSSRWIPHWIPAVAGDDAPSPGRIAARTTPPVHTAAAPGGSDVGLAFAGLRAAHAVGPLAAAAAGGGCGGRCTNPHAGSFETREGERKACWVQVWRQWPDGCAHYQWFNTCESYWDSDAEGPKVHWTCCVH
jgi:hypothetical protein